MNKFCYLCFVIVTLFLAGCSHDPYRGWSEIKSDKYKFKVKMPGQPRMESKTAPDGREINFWDYIEEDGSKFLAGYKVIFGPGTIAKGDTTEIVLDRLRDAFLKTTNGKLLKESGVARQAKIVGRQFKLEVPVMRKNISTAFFLNDGFVYQLSVSADSSWNGWYKADRFFDSFELLP